MENSQKLQPIVVSAPIFLQWKQWGPSRVVVNIFKNPAKIV